MLVQLERVCFAGTGPDLTSLDILCCPLYSASKMRIYALVVSRLFECWQQR